MVRKDELVKDPNEIERLKMKLETILPSSKIELVRPVATGKSWWLDIVTEDHHVSVEWRPGDGFGLSAVLLNRDNLPYGEAHDEVYATSDVGQIADRVSLLVRDKAVTAQSSESLLRMARAATGMTQVDVAEAMGVTQGVVSRVEHRDAVMVGTLRKFAQAIGGTLELKLTVGDVRISYMVEEARVLASALLDGVVARRRGHRGDHRAN